MWDDIKIFFKLLVFKASPGDIRASYRLFGGVIALSYMAMLGGFWTTPLLWGMLLVLLAWKLLYVMLILKMRRLSERFLQTSTALLGVTFLLALVKLACFHLLVQGVVLNGIVALLAIWELVITSVIFEKALSTHIGWAIVATIGLFLTSGFLMLLIL